MELPYDDIKKCESDPQKLKDFLVLKKLEPTQKNVEILQYLTKVRVDRPSLSGIYICYYIIFACYELNKNHNAIGPFKSIEVCIDEFNSDEIRYLGEIPSLKLLTNIIKTDCARLVTIPLKITDLKGAVNTVYVSIPRDAGIGFCRIFHDNQTTPDLFQCDDSIETIKKSVTESLKHKDFAQYLEILGLYKMSDEEKIILKPNSNSIMQDVSTIRFSSASWFEKVKEKTIIVAGQGGIGSYVSFLLSRMKPRSIFIYDDDSVETVNMSGQLYSSDDIGKKKVNAIANTCSKFSMYNNIFAIPNKFTPETESADIMICGFDNMSARRIFYHSWRKHVKNKPIGERKHCLFIDGRLSAETYQILCIRGDDEFNIDRYDKEFLFSDSEADATICSYKQTSFMASMIGSMMVNLFVNFCTNEDNDGQRDLPFFIEYKGDCLLFNVQQ